ncbi:DUF2982 domain-containing protein [Photobacterium halotolerans]|uniref:DUF2982 domain-containing protein n=1 Tax=Photobacterium halotolerans TaxID=265726 RepID=UPI0004149B4E|nr:DUF2982 domain-containing protein [Photobacterium halotolerans]
MNSVYIQSPHPKPGAYLIWLSLLAILVLGLTVFTFPDINGVAVALLLLAMTTLLLIGVKLNRQSPITFTLTFMHLQYHSPHGGWLTRWQNIADIGRASVSTQGWHKPLPWIGIRLKHYDEFLDSICPRIASQILMEQRGLMIMAYKRADNPPHEIEDMLFDDKHYVGDNGKINKGLLAMLANRMRYNRELMGYDFFISEDLLDRPADDFIGLARRFLAQAR